MDNSYLKETRRLYRLALNNQFGWNHEYLSSTKEYKVPPLQVIHTLSLRNEKVIRSLALVLNGIRVVCNSWRHKPFA